MQPDHAIAPAPPNAGAPPALMRAIRHPRRAPAAKRPIVGALPPRARPMLLVSDLVAAAAFVYGVPAAEITGPSRRACYVRPRHAVMYLARRLTRQSYPCVARALGLLDHTSVIYGDRSIAERLGYCIATRDAVARIAAAAAELSRERWDTAWTRYLDDLNARMDQVERCAPGACTCAPAEAAEAA